jgi:MFS family permease
VDSVAPVRRAASTNDGAMGRSFGTLVASSGMSNLADGVFKFALPLLAINYTRSPALVAGVQLVQTAPWLVGALPIGAVVDRIDRRRAMMAANAARAALVAVPAVLVAFDAGALWLFYVAAAGTGVAEVFYDTAAQSLLPSLVPKTRLDRANGRLFAVELGAQEFAGPPMAGVLVAAALAVPLAMSAGLWVVAVMALAALHGSFRPRRNRARTSIRVDVREGMSFVLRQPVLRTMALIVGMNNLASSAVFAVFVLFAVGTGSSMELTEPAFGLLFASLAAGGLIGGLVAESVQRRIGRARTITLSLMGMIVYVTAPAITSNVVVIALVLFTAGIMNMLWNVTTVSFRQRVTPDHLLGRMNSAYRLVAWGTRPLGAAIGGVLGQSLGLRSVFAVMGIVSAATLIPGRRLTEHALADAEADAATAASSPSPPTESDWASPRTVEDG